MLPIALHNAASLNDVEIISDNCNKTVLLIRKKVIERNATIIEETLFLISGKIFSSFLLNGLMVV